jgi:hypothetical protein
MIALGELCGLPKHQLATGFGFKTRKSYYDSRNAVLTGAPQDLLPGIHLSRDILWSQSG